jgi:hypothetical protein
VCYCPPGLQGNPQVSCIEVKCSTHQDCATNQVCDYPPGSQRKECLPLCQKNPCAPGAVCSASNHQERCECNPPLKGDGFVLCAERKNASINFCTVWMCLHQICSQLKRNFFSLAIVTEQPECRVDRDCPSKLACISETCQNPCSVNNPCSNDQKCVVIDSQPSRSVACICPEGSVFGGNGICTQGMRKHLMEFKLTLIGHLGPYIIHFFHFSSSKASMHGKWRLSLLRHLPAGKLYWCM